MSIKRLHSNPRMSAVVTNAGTVYLSGQVPSRVDVSCAEQCQEVLDKIDGLLADAGSHKSQLLSAQIWLTDIAEDFSAFNHVWEQWLQGAAPPVRATVQSPLAKAGAKVEIMVIAAVQ